VPWRPSSSRWLRNSPRSGSTASHPASWIPPWWGGLPEDARHAYFTQAAQQLPARRIATADDVADAVVLAATNPNITGTIIETDGGARLVSMS